MRNSTMVGPVLGFVAMLFVTTLHAYPRLVFDEEPNDTPDQARPASGEARLEGEVLEGDVDLYRWTLDEEEAERLWRLELQGHGEGRVAVEWRRPDTEADDGGTGGEVATFGAASDPTESGSEAEASRPLARLSASAEDPSRRLDGVLLPPGELLVRVSPEEGGGGYQLILTQDGPARVRGRLDAEGGDALEVAPGRDWFFRIDREEASLPLPVEEDPRQLWRLRLDGELGSDLEAWVESAEGEVLAEPVSATLLQQQWGRLALSEGSRLHLRHRENGEIGRVGVRLDEDGRRPASPEAGDAVAETSDDEREPEARPAGSPETRLWLAPGETRELETFPEERNARRYLGFRVDADTPPLRLGVTSSAGEDGPTPELCLEHLGSEAPVCRRGAAERVFEGMTLAPGDYALVLHQRGRGDDPVRYTLALEEDQPAETGWVQRPNDAREWAVALPAGEALRGRFTTGEEAWFELVVDDAPRRWRLRAEAESPLERLSLFRQGEGSAMLDSRQGSGSEAALRLEDVRLLPGRYLVRLNGEETDYRLLASPQEETAPGREIEPNDDGHQSNPLWHGSQVQGSFHASRDEDHFHFHLPGENRVALDLDPPEGTELQAELHWQDERRLRTSTEEPLQTTQMLPPGDYRLELSGDTASSASYRVGVEMVAPWASGGGPTSDPDEAPLLPADGEVHDQMGQRQSDGGYLRLPVTEAEREVIIDGELRGIRTELTFLTAGGDTLEIRELDERHRYAVTIPAGEEVVVEVGFGRYSRKTVLEDPAYPLPETPTLEVALDSDARALAPFASRGQRVPVTLRIENPDERASTVSLSAHLSHTGAVLEGLPETLALEPGQEIELPLMLALPPALLESAPVSLFVRAGRHADARLDLPLDVDTTPLDPFAVPEIPDALQGLPDLAWNALGATFVDPENGEPVDDLLQRRRGEAHFLIDGMASAGSSIQVTEDPGEALPPIRLAGEGGRVHGLAFNQRSRHALPDRWRDVEIALGTRHDDLEVVTTATLAPGDGEQFIELPAPREARYVRLRPLNLWGEPDRRWRNHGTGLLRVLGEPAGDLAERHHDLLDPDLGGHWIYTLPDIEALRGFLGQRYDYRGVMDERKMRRGAWIRDRGTIDTVFAFLHQRAARLESLRWIDDTDWDGVPVEEVEVYTATESPVGPWQTHGTWRLERDDEGMASFDFPAPIRARYLRLALEEPALPEGERRARWRVPRRLQAIEADTLGDGASILGHWGMDHSRGPLEAERQAPTVSGVEVEDDQSRDEDPWRLEESVSGRVETPGDSRHYRLTLDEGDNSLAFELTESQRGRLEATLVDPRGDSVSLDWRDAPGGGRRAEAEGLTPGEYRLSLEEPPRSVFFLWDGSGSLSKLQPTIYQALNRFAEGLRPGREVVNMLPLEGEPLIDGWATEPTQVIRTLGAYDGRFNSSDVEPTLKLASQELADRRGEKAIFLITDAQQTSRDPSVWRDLAAVRPRIFTLEVSHRDSVATEEYRWYQDQMLSWANVADGRYFYASDRSGMVRAFEAGMRQLRTPTTFTLAAESRYREPPTPGSLRVISGEAPVVSAGVVQLIFDASGSMLQAMEGGRRIEVARRIVVDVLDERLPEGVPVALRAFGHTQPDSCETELLVRPDDGNRDEVRRTVERIEAVNLARTPLAASLEAVREDLAGQDARRRLVVMLTDGEETCEGDVEAAVQTLVEEGVEVRVNIVGFHIDDADLRETFERVAELGGGDYFDSQDGDELVESLAGALAADWRVLDADDRVVARGRVDGEAVELDPGDYRLVVDERDTAIERDFRIAPDQDRTMEVTPDETGGDR